MIVGYVVKQPAEKLPVSLNFARALTTGETVASAVVTAATPGDAEPVVGVLDGDPALTDATVTQVVMNGTDAVDYVLTFQATTTPSGYVLEDEILVQVRES